MGLRLLLGGAEVVNGEMIVGHLTFMTILKDRCGSARMVIAFAGLASTAAHVSSAC